MRVKLVFFDIADLNIKREIEHYIKTSFPGWAKLKLGILVISTTYKTETIRNLIAETYPDAIIFVVDITQKAWATSNMNREINNWLKENI